MKNLKFIPLLVILLSLLIGGLLYSRLPEVMASHWNFQGQVDGYVSRPLGVFLMPGLTFLLYLFFLLIPKIDPLKENIKKFRKYFDWFINLIIFFLFYLYLLTLAWNLGLKFSFNSFLSPAFGVLWYFAGVLIEKSKRNWFIGIKTPWTLSDDEIWDKTHELGGKLFKAAAILPFLGVFFPKIAFFLAVIPILAVGLYLVIYSYRLYAKKSRG